MLCCDIKQVVHTAFNATLYLSKQQQATNLGYQTLM